MKKSQQKNTTPLLKRVSLHYDGVSLRSLLESAFLRLLSHGVEPNPGPSTAIINRSPTVHPKVRPSIQAPSRAQRDVNNTDWAEMGDGDVDQTHRPAAKAQMCRFCRKHHEGVCQQWMPEGKPRCFRCNEIGHVGKACPIHGGPDPRRSTTPPSSASATTSPPPAIRATSLGISPLPSSLRPSTSPSFSPPARILAHRKIVTPDVAAATFSAPVKAPEVTPPLSLRSDETHEESMIRAVMFALRPVLDALTETIQQLAVSSERQQKEHATVVEVLASLQQIVSRQGAAPNTSTHLVGHQATVGLVGQRGMTDASTYTVDVVAHDAAVGDLAVDVVDDMSAPSIISPSEEQWVDDQIDLVEWGSRIATISFDIMSMKPLDSIDVTVDATLATAPRPALLAVSPSAQLAASPFAPLAESAFAPLAESPFAPLAESASAPLAESPSAPLAESAFAPLARSTFPARRTTSTVIVDIASPCVAFATTNRPSIAVADLPTPRQTTDAQCNTTPFPESNNHFTTGPRVVCIACRELEEIERIAAVDESRRAEAIAHRAIMTAVNQRLSVEHEEVSARRLVIGEEWDSFSAIERDEYEEMKLLQPPGGRIDDEECGMSGQHLQHLRVPRGKIHRGVSGRVLDSDDEDLVFEDEDNVDVVDAASGDGVDDDLDTCSVVEAAEEVYRSLLADEWICELKSMHHALDDVVVSALHPLESDAVVDTFLQEGRHRETLRADEDVTFRTLLTLFADECEVRGLQRLELEGRCVITLHEFVYRPCPLVHLEPPLRHSHVGDFLAARVRALERGETTARGIVIVEEAASRPAAPRFPNEAFVDACVLRSGRAHLLC